MIQKTNKNLIQIHVSQLKLGMFVSELDKSWLDTPFVVQGMPMTSQRDIDAIAEHAIYVWIDPLKQAANSLGKLKTIDSLASPSQLKPLMKIPVAVEGHKRRRNYTNSVSAVAEHKVAEGLYVRSRKAVKAILTRVAEQGDVAIEEARSIVNSCVKSVIRNPDALMWMSKIRAQDEYTAEHCLNVCILAMVYGRHLGLVEKDIVRLGLCGLLHDVGKMKIPNELLNKAEKLSAVEFDLIKGHALKGYELLNSSQSFIPPIVAEVAKSHHERMDGRGYPHRVPAAALDDMVRMITLVDAYDAMTSDRCYSKGKSNTEALKIIYEQMGAQFDEKLAIEFIRCIGIYPAGTIVELMNGSVGVVIEINQQYRHLPKVLILRDAEGKEEHPYYLNLVEIEFGNLSSDHLVRSTLRNGALGIAVGDYLNVDIKQDFTG
jgi:putative nucleotidyltransferase with HDIG domain